MNEKRQNKKEIYRSLLLVFLGNAASGGGL